MSKRSDSIDHGARDHAAWSASASDRLWACPGSLVLNAGLPDKENEYAAWGTACHQVSEKCLREDKAAVEFLGTVEKTKAFAFTVDDEMAECAQVYVDYVRGNMSPRANLKIEQKFSLADLNPPFEAGGTGDAVILDHDRKTVHIIDLKTGRNVVEVTDNKQLRTYGLGALMANPGDWHRVKVTVVQPRAAHPDGRIRSEEFDVVDLIDWTADLLDAMQAADEASIRREMTSAGKVTAEWAGNWLRAGDHCHYCKAAPTCPALSEKALAEARVFFDPQGVKPPPAPETLDTAQLARVLDHADMIENWLNAVRAHARELVEGGGDVPGYVLVPKRAMRKWRDDADVPVALASRLDRSPDDFYQPAKPMTPPMVEKLLGKKGYEAVKDLVVQESSGFNLVRGDKTTRGAVEAPVKQLFQVIEGDKA